MNKKHLIACVSALFLWTSCMNNSSSHFISDTAYRTQVETDFQSRQTTLSEGNLFTVFNQSMTPEEKEIARLKRENRDLKDALDILKKAISILND